MIDAGLALGWLVVLAGGLGACAILFRLGVPRTYVRDLLHVAASVWVFGWRYWQAPGWPVAIAVGALGFIVALPALGAWVPVLAKVANAVSDQDERWGGIALYTASFAVMTVLGFFHQPFPAAGALFALALGDGLGGLVGRKWGRTRFQLPGAKPKTFEGAAAVAAGAAAGVLLAGWWYATPAGVLTITVAAVAAALAEAIAPRASDNLTVPLAVWVVLAAAT